MEWFSRKTSIAGTQISNWILVLATFRRKIDVSGIEVSWLPQNKARRGERRARVGLD